MHTCARANTPLRPPPNPRLATSAAHPLPLSRAARRDSDARSASLTDAGRGAAPVAGVVVRRGRVTTAEPQRATEGGADPAGARGARAVAATGGVSATFLFSGPLGPLVQAALSTTVHIWTAVAWVAARPCDYPIGSIPSTRCARWTA